MQIRINLHTQRGRRGRGRLALPQPGAALARLLSPARDKFLLGAFAAVAASCAAVAALHTTQQKAVAEVAAQEAQAVRDSARFAVAIAARAEALAMRDSVVRQLRVIATIDSTRYVWAHLLDEVSRALPPYTWLTTVQQTSAPPAPLAPVPVKGAKGAKRPPNGARIAADSAAGPVRLRVVGQTVDIQALTLFMRDLETSAFVRNVQLVHSQPLQGSTSGAREVTEFTLDAEFEQPARGALRTVSIAVPVR